MITFVNNNKDIIKMTKRIYVQKMCRYKVYKDQTIVHCYTCINRVAWTILNYFNIEKVAFKAI